MRMVGWKKREWFDGGGEKFKSVYFKSVYVISEG